MIQLVEQDTCQALDLILQLGYLALRTAALGLETFQLLGKMPLLGLRLGEFLLPSGLALGQCGLACRHLLGSLQQLAATLLKLGRLVLQALELFCCRPHGDSIFLGPPSTDTLQLAFHASRILSAQDELLAVFFECQRLLGKLALLLFQSQAAFPALLAQGGIFKP